MSCQCQFPYVNAKMQAVSEFLTEFGDDIPAETIAKATRSPEGWHTFCDCKDKAKLTSVGKWEKSDWYLCTIKHLATRPQNRGQGLSGKLSNRIKKDALRNECLVIAADVTATNIPSQKIFSKMKFKKVNSFCWRRGEGAKPANILHYVLLTPRKGGIC